MVEVAGDVSAIDEAPSLDQFQNAVIGEQLTPLWTVTVNKVQEPHSHIQPHLWRWTDLRRRILQAAALIPVGEEGADRRVLTLRNPGLPPGRMGTTQNLVAGIQLVHGGEAAPPHRHTPAAIRFVKEGKGACTVVNGEPESMEPGDLLLTPNWYWHSHFSEHAEPMIWMDGLDAPLVYTLGLNFYEELPSRDQPVTAARDESIRRYGGGGLVPVGAPTSSGNSPLLNYRWAQTEQKLKHLANSKGSRCDGIALRYTNVANGGPVMPTIDCWIQALRPGEHTKSHRHTSSVIYNVVRGCGFTVIDGQRFDWRDGDIVCIPPWAIHEHANTSRSEDAILFSMNDSPVLQSLGLYREADYEEGDGHQRISSVFAG